MIAEAMQFVRDLAHKSARPEPVPVADPHRARFVINGGVVEVPLPPPPRGHKVGALDDVISLAVRFAGDAERIRQSVWVNESAVVLVLDDDGHRVETATLALEKSDVFTLLESIRGGKAWFDHKPFVRLLKVELAGAGEDVSRLLESVRRVQFENGVVTASRLSRADESLGRTITAKVDTATVLPDSIKVQAPVYKTSGERERHPIACALDVEPALGKFQLLPAPDELERVVQFHLSSISERLKAGLAETSVPVYFGAP